MKQGSRKAFLLAALIAVGVFGIAAHALWAPSKFASYATFISALALVLLMRQAAKWQLLQLPSTFPLPIPQVPARWNGRTLVIGLLCFPAAFAWAALVGIVFRERPDISLWMGWLLIGPSLALIVLGTIRLWRGVFSRWSLGSPNGGVV